MSRHGACHLPSEKKSKIPVPSNEVIKTHVTAAEMAAVRKDVKALSSKQEEVKKYVLQSAGAAATITESVVKKIELFKSQHKEEMSQMKKDLTLDKNEILKAASAEMGAVRRDVKALSYNQEETKRSISQTVAAAASVAEAIVEEVEILKSERKEIMKTVAASASHVKAIGKDMKALNSDGKELKAAVFELKGQLREIKETMKEGKNVKIDKPAESAPRYQLSVLPSKSLDELKDLLDYVQTVLGYTEFTAYISILCGDDLKKSIRVILNRIMVPEVQKQLSWSGYRTTKPSFEKGYGRIVDAISQTLQQKFKEYNYEVLQKKVSTLLSNA